MVISYKQDIQAEFFTLLPAVKVENNYESIIKYEDKPFLFNTSRCSISGNNVILDIKIKPFLDSLKHQLCVYMSENSKIIFNSKVFSLQKIQNSFMNFYTENEKNLEMEISYSNKITLSEPLGEIKEADKDNLPKKDVTCVIHLQKITFVKDKFFLVFKISHLKLQKYKNDNIGFDNDKNFFD